MRIDGMHTRTVALDGAVVDLLDQRNLPHRVARLRLTTVEEVAFAIEDMAVRGAGAIGATAAAGMAIAAHGARPDQVVPRLEAAAERLRHTRPTAQNLFAGIDAVLAAAKRDPALVAMAAKRFIDADAAACEAIGQHGAGLLHDGANIATHCNAGWLAFVDWGSAMAPVYTAHRAGRALHVWVDETRPRSQGARLTAFELGHEGVPHTVIPDNALASRMAAGQVDIVFTGADRIAANGDVANKIGTYAVALLAHAHGIPFWVCAPSTTFDLDTYEGRGIPIEERSPDEVAWTWGEDEDGELRRVRTTTSPARNWAFDITPAHLVTGLITEHGRVEANRDAIAVHLRG